VGGEQWTKCPCREEDQQLLLVGQKSKAQSESGDVTAGTGRKKKYVKRISGQEQRGPTRAVRSGRKPDGATGVELR